MLQEGQEIKYNNNDSTMKNGKIGVTTENIFPVIKKFLYSDHEIFLRELISNAVDATQKLKTLSSIGEAKGDLGDVTIRVAADKEKKTLTVTDRGRELSPEHLERIFEKFFRADAARGSDGGGAGLGLAIAREIADITIAANDLFELVQLRRLSMALMNRIQSNYRFVIGFNGGLIALGALGVLAPATSATLHNLSTLGISLRSMTSLLPPAKA